MRRTTPGTTASGPRSSSESCHPRRSKPIAYHAISSLTAYVIVEQDRLALTAQRRIEAGGRPEVLGGRSEILRLSDVGFEIPLERIYERAAALPSNPPA